MTLTLERQQTTPRAPLRVQAKLVWLLMLALLAAAVWSFGQLGINVEEIAQGTTYAGKFVERMLPLDFPPVSEVLGLTATTLALVVLATALAVLVSLPVALMAASTTTTGPIARACARGFTALMRAVPDVVLAIVFFRLLGLGTLPGVLALALHSVGMVAKLYADAIETLDHGPPEALEAAGAGRGQRIMSGVMPQLAPQLIATGLHRFDINLRSSVVLGYVGVGGIGLAISDALNTLNYQRGMALALIVLLLCISLELLSGMLRARLLKGPGGSGSWVRGTHDVQRTRSGRVRVSPPWDAERLRRAVGLAITVIILAAATLGSDIHPLEVVSGFFDKIDTLAQFWPPSAGGLDEKLLDALLITIQIGLASTLIGVVLAAPIGALAARNVAPNRTTALVFRTIIVALRGVPELILAIVLIVMLGLGPPAGTIALGIGSIGLLGKLIADSIEETDTRVQDAIRANGAGGVQVFFAATLRQAAPAFVAHVLYQLDVNVRSATLLGIVGAGGIGFYLLSASRVLAFDTVTYIVLMILAVVLVLEALSAWTRSVVR